MKQRLILAFAILIALPSSLANAQDKDTGTHTVKKGFFEVVEEVNATVESKNMTEVRATTDAWTDLEISKIVAEGSRVTTDDPIIWFKTEDIDRKIRETEYGLQLGELTLKVSGLDLDLAVNTFGLDTQLNERKMKHLEEDYKYFVDIDRPNREKNTRRNVENSQHSLEYAQEELNQLNRMYSEDELTEESEEIVLKRAQRDVENRQFYLEQAQLRASRTLDVDLPREAEQKRESLERTRLENEKAAVQMPLERDKKQVTYEKARLAFANQKADYDNLVSDRERLTLSAPSEGVLYYGYCVRGKWMGVAGADRTLRAGKKVPANKIVATIVDTSQLMLRADLTESQLAGIRVGSQGVMTPASLPQNRIPASVSAISYVPVKANTFDCQLELGEVPEGLMPGMTCKVRFVVRQNPEAVTIPSSAVFTDDGTRYYVLVAGGEKKTVTVGLTADKKTEIMSGLSAGDEILTERPE